MSTATRPAGAAHHHRSGPSSYQPPRPHPTATSGQSRTVGPARAPGTMYASGPVLWPPPTDRGEGAESRLWEQRAARERDEAWAAEQHHRIVRGKAALRVRLFNLNHADHAWQLRHSFGIAPTAVALLYADPTPTGGLDIRLAGRLLADGPDVADPTRVLYHLTGVARDVIGSGGDPRADMSERPEPMSPAAFYCGVVVSLLDTPDGTWQEARRHASGASSVPGRCLVLLTDTTMMLADRREPHRVDNYVVHTTHHLDPGMGPMSRDTWLLTPDLAQLADEATRPIWIRLNDLHTTLSTGGARHGG